MKRFFEGVGDSIHNDTDTVPIESTARKAVFQGSLKNLNIVDPMEIKKWHLYDIVVDIA